MLLENGTLFLVEKTGIAKVDKHFGTFDEKYRMVSDEDCILPFIRCNACENVWRLYKFQNGLTKSNPRSNIESHLCNETRTQAKIDQITPKDMGQYRDEVSKSFSQILSRYPTISTQAGTQLMNDIANYVSSFTIMRKKNFNFNLSRQNISDKTKDLARAKAAKNIDQFCANYDQSSILIDHWSAHGRNFFAIIARVYDFQALTESNPCPVNEFLLHFSEANSDKSAKGKNSLVIFLFKIRCIRGHQAIFV